MAASASARRRAPVHWRECRGRLPYPRGGSVRQAATWPPPHPLGVACRSSARVQGAVAAGRQAEEGPGAGEHPGQQADALEARADASGVRLPRAAHYPVTTRWGTGCSRLPTREGLPAVTSRAGAGEAARDRRRIGVSAPRASGRRRSSTTAACRASAGGRDARPNRGLRRGNTAPRDDRGAGPVRRTRRCRSPGAVTGAHRGAPNAARYDRLSNLPRIPAYRPPRDHDWPRSAASLLGGPGGNWRLVAAADAGNPIRPGADNLPPLPQRRRTGGLTHRSVRRPSERGPRRGPATFGFWYSPRGTNPARRRWRTCSTNSGKPSPTHSRRIHERAILNSATARSSCSS